MDKLYKKIVNCETGEEITREFNKEEYAQYQADEDAQKIKQVQAEAKAQAKAELLQRLGISEEEAKLLLS